MTDLFERRAWLTDFEGIAGLPPGMLGHFEANLLYLIARETYRGYGDIVDAGSFLGASSWCLTKGLEENSLVAKKSGRVHAYDLFQVWSEPGGTDAAMANSLRNLYKVELAGYESTVGIYTQNLGAFARHVQVHPGDILETSWSGRPIEILFIDICKVKAIWMHLIRSFFPSLMPGISVAIHQDWHHPWLPYLHVGQEALSDYFELIVPKANDTAVFRLIDRIPERVLDRVARYDFSKSEEIALMDRCIARFAAHKQARFVRLAKAELLRQQGRFDAASEVVHRSVADDREEMTPEEQTWFEVHAAAVANRIETEAMGESPPDFDERYLAAHPELTEVRDGGHFRSLHHHWFRHGRWAGLQPLPS